MPHARAGYEQFDYPGRYVEIGNGENLFRRAAGRNGVLAYYAEWQTLLMRRNTAECRLFRPTVLIVPAMP